MIYTPSLIRRLLLTLVGSLSLVAILLGAGGAWLINGIVERTSDRLLGASARAIAETLAVEEGEITLDLPPFALGMLENTARDNIYYVVRHNGRLLTGYPDLPSTAAQPNETSFRYEQFRGARIRVAAETRSLPRIDGLIVVEVAETLDARKDLARRMLLGLAALEGAFIAVAALLVWPAVKWSLRPITRLRKAMDGRRADFTPLPASDVPSELQSLVAGFNALLARLETSVQGMRRFTADASHQMRTPLAILRTHLAVVRKHGSDSDEGRASLEDIQHALDRLQGLLTGLITLARNEEEGVEPDLTQIDLRELIQQVIVDHEASASHAGVTVDLVAPDAVELRTAPVLLTELLANLIDNGVRYNRSGGRVEIAIERRGEAVQIVVSDDGPGIPPDQLDRVFERFYRLSRDQQTGGSGLGLPIAGVIARRLGAELSLSSSMGGRGLRATVTLRV